MNLGLSEFEVWPVKFEGVQILLYLGSIQHQSLTCIWKPAVLLNKRNFHCFWLASISGPEQVLHVDLLSGYSSAKFSFAIKVFISITFDNHGHSDQDLWSQLHAGESFDYAWTLQLKNGAGDLSYIHLLDRLPVFTNNLTSKYLLKKTHHKEHKCWGRLERRIHCCWSPTVWRNPRGSLNDI